MHDAVYCLGGRGGEGSQETRQYGSVDLSRSYSLRKGVYSTTARSITNSTNQIAPRTASRNCELTRQRLGKLICPVPIQIQRITTLYGRSIRRPWLSKCGYVSNCIASHRIAYMHACNLWRFPRSSDLECIVSVARNLEYSYVQSSN